MGKMLEDWQMRLAWAACRALVVLLPLLALINDATVQVVQR